MHCVLVGYSRGADVLPFLAHRLSADARKKVGLVALLGLESSVEFEIHPSDFFNVASRHALPIRPEIEKMSGFRVLCFYGEDEKDSLCPELSPAQADVRRMKGGHHFGGDYKTLAQEIIKALPADR